MIIKTQSVSQTLGWQLSQLGEWAQFGLSVSRRALAQSD